MRKAAETTIPGLGSVVTWHEGGKTGYSTVIKDAEGNQIGEAIYEFNRASALRTHAAEAATMQAAAEDMAKSEARQ